MKVFDRKKNPKKFDFSGGGQSKETPPNGQLAVNKARSSNLSAIVKSPKSTPDQPLSAIKNRKQ